jgi:hypothetical protein
MPVTLNLAQHPATAWDKPKSPSASELLQTAAPREHERCRGLIQASFAPGQFDSDHITPSENGFVWAACHAYSHHHHLRIRPEDVWFAVLAQIGFFINGRADGELGSLFVAHGRRREPEVVHYTADFGSLAAQMGDMIGNYVTHPGWRDWVLPAFSTTTSTDRVVGSILFTGRMVRHFSEYMSVWCGLPSVTLLGCVEDWDNILNRLDKLDLLGDEPRQFAAMLRPILRRMVSSFTDPTSPVILDFWNRIVHRKSLGSGTDILSGWLTAFCFWDEDGIPNRPRRHRVLEDIRYPSIDMDSIPVGFSSLPISVGTGVTSTRRQWLLDQSASLLLLPAMRRL